MTLNIDRSNPDQFYRYKMPRLVAKVEGSGNGIKTVVANITEIAKSLDRPPAYPLKYFGYELGAQTMIDSKNDRYIVNGAHEAPRLQEMLDGFIKKFVLCQSCNNPETVLQVYPKKNTIKQNCAACGYSCMVDMKHKLTTYILKNPPAEVGEYGESKGKGKGKVKGRKGSGKEDEKNGGSKTNGAGDKAAPGSPTTETENPFDAPPPVDAVDGDEFDDDWGDEDTEQARKRTRKELTNGIKNLTTNDDLDKTEDERLDLFYEFVKKRKQGDQVDDKEILVEAERLEVKEKAPLILARVLLDTNMMKQIKDYRKVFLRFTAGNQRAQKYFLGGVEHIVGVAHSSELMPKAVVLFKELYDRDILEEEVLVDWYDKPTKKYVAKSIAEEIRKKVFPFIKWLKEAESETDESDEDDGIPLAPSAVNKAGGDVKGGNVVGTNNSKAATINGGPKVNGNGIGTNTPPTEEEDEEEVDIDAI
ncbi:eukaryotic translation initiation factor 5-like [Paramacrobiotus metropolitanus]|uniref:eukaryotic translation initiation factor 5-like n=1 Tax=Paramacrobiotus metropolitanus TaxID=2943436 RepID=UPI0024465031|nr:eukaryotic translation initiation factor 5-like [Paramacrobiotus metropolitanus]